MQATKLQYVRQGTRLAAHQRMGGPVMKCTGKIRCYRVRLNAGGYERGRFGQYFGQGAPLYRWVTDDDQGEVRAPDRASALAQVAALSKRCATDACCQQCTQRGLALGKVIS